MITEEFVILVDENDKEIATMEKIEAHLHGGRLHRAFSGFLFNDKNELLLQQRAHGKYHNPGIWSNTVCSHPRPGEKTDAAVKRRVFEELGFDADFKEIGQFVYKQSFSNGLTEYEFDHVFIGKYDGAEVKPNLDEVADHKWVSLKNLEKDMKRNPDRYSYWLQEILQKGILS